MLQTYHPLTYTLPLALLLLSDLIFSTVFHLGSFVSHIKELSIRHTRLSSFRDRAFIAVALILSNRLPVRIVMPCLWSFSKNCWNATYSLMPLAFEIFVLIKLRLLKMCYINLMYYYNLLNASVNMSLDCSKKSEHSEKTHTDTGKTKHFSV